MSLFKQENVVEPLDIDRYFDLDQGTFSPLSSSSKGKAIQTPEFHTPVPSRPYLAQQDGRPIFSGPSHQYDQHPQQTPLPSGALANALAANQHTAFHSGGYSNTHAYAGSSSVDFDFGATMPAHHSAFLSSGTDVDMDFGSPTTDGAYFGSDSDYVDPNAIGGHENTSPQPSRPEVVRFFPGMHTKQAEIAKQQQQQEIQRQQQVKAVAQQAQPVPGHKRNASRSNGGGSKPTDPVVEERISRLLSQMRNGSVASSNGDNATSQPDHSQRSRKEEEDMDEDERLLASEEGKKLTSKERRQLRNKVSARAFRSRRKEYIGQLEGELAIKGQENDDLHAENDALRAENTRLTDLSKMLLSSPAFSTFLNDLSANGVPTSLAAFAPQQQQALRQQHTPLQQQTPKDINPSQHYAQAQHPPAHIGMALIPEPSIDFLQPADGNWNVGMDYGFNTNAQVFSVTELPLGPAVDSIDTGVLSGKSSNFVPSFTSEVKDNTPVREFMPTREVVSETKEVAPTCNEDVEFDESDPAFALFVDTPSTKPVKSSEPECLLFGDIALEKAFARIDLYFEGSNDDSTGVSASTMARFESFCSSLDETSSRLAILTAHL